MDFGTTNCLTYINSCSKLAENGLVVADENNRHVSKDSGKPVLYEMCPI